MKTKISAAAIGLLFLMACGSSDKPKEEGQQAPAEASTSSKFILKASNMMYLTLTPESFLTANQADPTKAEVFEKIDQGDGKSALKASNGKFLSADEYRGDTLIANRDKAGAWETFEIIALDPTKINLKSFKGKFASYNPEPGNKIVINRDEPKDWEVFYMEQK